MKHKYLSLIALTGAMFMSASAWAVDPPQEVEPAYTTDWTAPEDGGVYFLYNVGADQFLGAGNNWGTHVVTATEQEDVIPLYYWDADVALSGGQTDMNAGMILPVKLTKTENGTFYIEHVGSNRTACYLTSEDGNSWIDGDAGRRIDFIITEAEGGYTIQATNTVEAETFFGAVDPEVMPEDGIVVRNVMNNLTAETGHIIWRFAPTNYNACMAYEVRLSLYDKIVEAEEAGVDVSAAEAVYNDANATAEDVQNVINALTLAINKKNFAEIFADASDDNPMDVTEFALVNPTFDSGVDGWVITVTGQNLGWQARTDTNTETGAQITNFIEAWINQATEPGHLGDGVIAQTVYGLPEGKYVLECDATACHDPASGDGSDIEGVSIFIQAGNALTETKVATVRLGVTHFTTTFISQGEDEISFGLKVEGTNANWISADNFKLTYYGKFEGTPEQAQLQSAIKNAESSVEKIESGLYMAYTPLIEAFESALEEAQSLAASEATAEEYLAAQAKLEAAQADYEASVKAYEKLGKFIGADGSASKLDEYMEMAGNWTELYDELEPWESELKDGYYDGTITTERMDEIMGSFLNKIREYIKKEGNIQPGDDVTLLMDNPNFDEGTTANPTGWTIKSGGLTELRLKTSNIETWHNTFDICQTIADMPAGIYDITVQGFVRHDDASDTERTVFYAGDTQTTLMTLEDQWSLEPIWLETTDEKPELGDANHDLTLTTPDGQTAYKANGMTGSYYWFQTPIPTELYDTFKYKPQDGDNFYTNHIHVVLKQKGDFTIGLKTESGTEWVIWDNFKIKYIGEDIDIYIQMVLDEAAKLQTAYEATDAFVTAKGEADYKTISAKVDNVKNIETSAEALALIDEIDELIAYINAGNKLGASLRSTYYLYNETLLNTYTSSDTAFPALLEEVSASITDPTQLADNDAIEPLISQLKKGWTKYVMADHIAGASELTPEDVTAAIFNPDYTDYNLNVEQPTNADGWTNEGSNGSTVYNGTYYEEIEFYNTNFNHYQTIQGLEPGWYVVANEAFYRAGDAGAVATAYNDSVPAQNAYMYAVVAGDTVQTVALKGMLEGALTEATGADGEITVDLKVEDGAKVPFYVPNLMGSAYAYLTYEDENGSKLFSNQMAVEVKEDGVLTIGVRKDNLITNDWTVISQWSLAYVGKEAPSAVNSIEKKQSVKMAQVFGIDGRQQSRLQRGINIVRMADGSVQKVLVK